MALGTGPVVVVVVIVVRTPAPWQCGLLAVYRPADSLAEQVTPRSHRAPEA